MTSDIAPFADASLLEEEVREYRDLFEDAPDGYAVTDLRGVLSRANRTLAVMLGVHSKFLERKLLVSFVARGDVKRFRAALARLAMGEGDREIVSLRLRPRHGLPPFVADLSPRVARRAGERVTSIRWGVRKAADGLQRHSPAVIRSVEVSSVEANAVDPPDETSPPRGE